MKQKLTKYLHRPGFDRVNHILPGSKCQCNSNWGSAFNRGDAVFLQNSHCYCQTCGMSIWYDKETVKMYNNLKEMNQ